ncbi:hypothetical protein GCM10010123_37930 [Pilimelia anulata]|uniref:Uncharacterized protein n=1 Tax=Pilimelia anulata TaxID=53371 RepID=A0A8J3BF67_9ACTN|nr:hypothetical protein [Pilimelia anulata]GGK04400.1 hypothetical protein GCM10010123_37930 [Pilimelia anulata]
MRVTVESVLPARHVDAMFDLYVEAFAPLATKAVARHVLTRPEFAAEMADPRIEKYVAWDGDDRPVGLSTLALDLAAVPWVNPAHLAARYPEQHARGAIFYLGFTLVRHDLQGSRTYLELNNRAAIRSRAARAVVGIDVCAYNRARNLPRSFAMIGRRHGFGFGEVDQQRYFVLDPALAGRPDGVAVPRPVGGLSIVPLADRPELAAQVPEVLASRWPAFMLFGQAGHGVDVAEVIARCPRHQVLLVDGEDAVHGAGLSVPLRWDGTPADLPAGWDGAIARADAQWRAGDRPDAVCALSITLTPAVAGQGRSAEMIAALRAAAAGIGARAMIAPVRPILKEKYPLAPMDAYVNWRDEKGRVFDPWLRLHLDAGATLLGVAESSLSVTGTVAEWQEWTGRPLPVAGEYVIPGGLVPLRVDTASDVGRYSEPNVWVAHPING